jgi:hypothetical protein
MLRTIRNHLQNAGFSLFRSTRNTLLATLYSKDLILFQSRKYMDLFSFFCGRTYKLSGKSVKVVQLHRSGICLPSDSLRSYKGRLYERQTAPAYLVYSNSFHSQVSHKKPVRTDFKAHTSFLSPLVLKCVLFSLLSHLSPRFGYKVQER